MDFRQEIINSLRNFVRKDFYNELLVFLFGLGIGLLFLLMVVLVFFIHPLFLLLVLPLILFLARNLWRKRPLIAVARRIEEGFPQLRDYLVNAVDLSFYSINAKEGYSLELVDAVIKDTAERLAPLPITSLIDTQKTKKVALVFVILLVILGLYHIILPNRAQLGFYRAFAPNKIPIEFFITPGNDKVAKGSKVGLAIKINSPYHFNQAIFVRKNLTDGIISKKRVNLTNQSGWIEVIADKEFDYSFQVFCRQSPIYHIGLLKPLGLTNLSFKYIYPPYTGLASVNSTARVISVLPGTRIELSGSAENNLASAKLLFSDSTLIPLNFSEKKFFGSFVAKKDVNFTIRLKDIDGDENEPELFKITLMPDETPFIKVFLPGHDIDLPVSMKVLLGINSLDDYGLTELNLNYEKGEEKKQIRLKNLSGRLEDTTYYYWDLTNLGFMPGEFIRYYLTVLDNDAVQGPKKTASEVFTIRFPTIAEIYSQTTIKTAETQERLEPLATEQEELGKELERIDQELKKERKLDWEEKKSLENLISNQKQLLDKIEELKEEVRNTLENMFEGLMLDKESLEKLRELENLLAELLPEELKQALRNLAQALQKPSADLKPAIEQFKLSQETLKKAIERAVELLKNIQEEEKLSSLAKKAEALYQAQKELENKFNEDLKKLAPEENKIKEGLESLEKETSDLSKTFSDKEISEELMKLAEELEKLELSEQAQELSQTLQKGEKGQAQKQSQKLLKDLAGIKDALSTLSQKLKDKRSQVISENLLNSARSLIALSQEQERLENLLNKDYNLSELAGAQKRLEEASRALAESLAVLSQKSIKIPPNLNEDLIRSLLNMTNAANSLQNNNLPEARRMMQSARSGLDATTARILNTLAQAQKGGGFGGGLENLLEQLSRLTAEQMMLNQELGAIPLPIPTPGGLTPQQLAQIERILSKQRALRQTLEEIRKSLGTEPGLTSSLDGVIEEMKQVERDLSELVITRELIQRQEKILNRLLDVQRSVRRREFKEKREREIGKDYPVPPNPTLPADLGERKKFLREKLLQGLKEGYPKDYEYLIRLYFESLINE
ncbi:MAG: hypothetical protein ABIK93_09130 [candidate division WOR-3 bacterium]